MRKQRKLTEITDDMFPMVLVEDLGIVGRHRKAAFICNHCGNRFETNVYTAKSSKTGKCKDCVNKGRPKPALRPLDLTKIPLKVLKDLGTGPSGKRRATFECPFCFKPFDANVGNVKTKTTTKCHSCGLIHGPRPGFKEDQESTFYVLKFLGTDLIKIGITNTSVNKRYQKKEQRTFKVMHEVVFTKGIDAFRFEQYLLTKYSHIKYTEKKKLLISGNKEILATDIFTNTYEGSINESISSWGEHTGQFTWTSF